MQEFKIFSVPVAAGTLAISPLPGRGGNFAGDMATLLKWRPSVVVTMVENTELDAYGAQGLGGAIGGAVWLHMPVPDYQTPDAQQDAAWSGLQAKLLAVLHDGGRVLIHCMGGCGRSGMVALRLMIAAGEPPDRALARLRAVRPCAVETEAQMAWAVNWSTTADKAL